MSATDQFTENASLTAIAIAYNNPDVALIADEVLPRVKVPGRTYKWQLYNEAANFTVPDTRVGRRSQPNQIEIEGSEQKGAVEAYGIDVPLDNVTIEEGKRNKFDPRRQATELATDVVMLDREVRVVKIEELRTAPSAVVGQFRTAPMAVVQFKSIARRRKLRSECNKHDLRRSTIGETVSQPPNRDSSTPSTS